MTIHLQAQRVIDDVSTDTTPTEVTRHSPFTWLRVTVVGDTPNTPSEGIVLPDNPEIGDSIDLYVISYPTSVVYGPQVWNLYPSPGSHFEGYSTDAPLVAGPNTLRLRYVDTDRWILG